MSCMPSNRELASLDRPDARRSLFMAAIGLATIAASFAYAPWSLDGPVFCAFRWLTGLPCPGCGLTRSFCAVAQGDLVHGFHWHILGPLLFAAVVIGAPLLLAQGLLRRRLRGVNMILFSRRTAYAVAVLLGAFQVFRVVSMARSGTLWPDIRTSAIARILGWVFE